MFPVTSSTTVCIQYSVYLAGFTKRVYQNKLLPKKNVYEVPKFYATGNSWITVYHIGRGQIVLEVLGITN